MKTSFSFILFMLFLLFGCNEYIKAQQENFDEIQGKSDSIKYPFTFKFNGNPLVRYQSATDPNAIVWDGRVWVYTSQDHPKKKNGKGVYDAMDGYHVYSTSDMVNWTDHGEILHSRDVSWGIDGWMWAPGVARKDGKYYLYFPHKDKEEIWRIGVAISDSPAGPFTDIGHYIEGLRGIDPMVFIDDNGDAYIYLNMDGEAFNYNNSTRVARLKPNMIELAEEARQIDYAPRNVMETDTLRFLEGAFMHKKNGVYYFTYTNWQNKTHHGYYCTGNNPYGPFEWKGAMAPKPEGAQDHHSIIEFKDKWYYFYQVGGSEFKPAGYDGIRRVACFDGLFYNEDGTLKMVEHSH